MAKPDLDLINAVLICNELGASLIAKIIEDISIELKRIEAEKELKQKIEKKFVFITFPLRDLLVGKASDNALQALERIQKSAAELQSGWVLQIAESANENEIFDRINLAVIDFNNSKRGIRNPVKKLSDAFEFVPARFWKSQEIWIKTKEPTSLMHSPNTLVLGKVRESEDV